MGAEICNGINKCMLCWLAGRGPVGSRNVRKTQISQLTTNPCLLARVFLGSFISVDRVQIAGSLKVLKDLIFVAAGRRMKASPPPELQVPVFFLKDLGSRARETLLLSSPSSEVT